MYKRLTRRIGNTVDFVDGQRMLLARLAAYEDSGLSPEQVQELVKVKAEGRLVVLPCKVGENCFAVNHTEKKILEITVSEYSYSIWHDAWIVSAANGCQFFLDNTYRTREAAEKAISEVMNK